MSSLVSELEKSTLWTAGESRWMVAGITEVVAIDARGSRDGMFSKIECPVQETRFGCWGGHRPVPIRQRKCTGPKRESEGFKVPIEADNTPQPREGALLGSLHRLCDRYDRPIASFVVLADQAENW